MNTANIKKRFRLISFKTMPHGEPRNMIVDVESHQPIISASVYEAHLAAAYESHNTRRNSLHSLKFLYTWCQESRVDIESALLRGEGLKPNLVRSFAHWLKGVFSDTNKIMTHATKRNINRIFTDCATACSWFVRDFHERDYGNKNWIVEHERLIAYQKELWKTPQYSVKKKRVADDLLDEEVAKINNFLLPKNRSINTNIDIAVRDFLIWRMVIECGMRIGEVMAMRLEDCPTKDNPAFEIVRIDERNDDYYDPRPNPPRPKTLSRPNGFLFENTVFPKLVFKYITDHRYILAEYKGRKSKKWNVGHNFLIIAQGGQPISKATAGEVARKIREGTGIDFHWHLGRHAFFNRAYAALGNNFDSKGNEMRINDLVHWGGWSDPKSLDIYATRAKEERARYALGLFQNSARTWEALS